MGRKEFLVLQQRKDVAQRGNGERQNKIQGEAELIQGESLPSNESLLIHQLISACASVVWLCAFHISQVSLGGA